MGRKAGLLTITAISSILANQQRIIIISEIHAGRGEREREAQGTGMGMEGREEKGGGRRVYLLLLQFFPSQPARQEQL